MNTNILGCKVVTYNNVFLPPINFISVRFLNKYNTYSTTENKFSKIEIIYVKNNNNRNHLC